MPKAKKLRSRARHARGDTFNANIRRLRSRNVGKVKCAPAGNGTTLCAIGRKFGFEVRLYGKGSTYPDGKWLPVSTPRTQTAASALSHGRAFINRVRKGR